MMDDVVLQQFLSLGEGLEEESLINNNLSDNSGEQTVDSDSKLLRSSDTNSLSAHNDQYTALLRAYVDNFKAISNDYKLFV